MDDLLVDEPRTAPQTKIGSRVMIAETDLEGFIASCNPETAANATVPGLERQ